MTIVLDTAVNFEPNVGSLCIFNQNGPHLILHTTIGDLVVYINSDSRYNNFIFAINSDVPCVILQFGDISKSFGSYEVEDDLYYDYKISQTEINTILNVESIAISSIKSKPLNIDPSEELLKFKNYCCYEYSGAVCKIVAINEAAKNKFKNILPCIRYNKSFFRPSHDYVLDVDHVFDWNNLSKQTSYNIKQYNDIDTYGFIITWEQVNLDKVFVVTKENIREVNAYDAVNCCIDFFSNHMKRNIFAFSMYIEHIFCIDFNLLSTYMLLDLDIATLLYNLKNVEKCTEDMVYTMIKPVNGCFNGYCSKDYLKLCLNKLYPNEYDSNISKPLYDAIIKLKQICKQPEIRNKIIECYTKHMYQLVMEHYNDKIDFDKFDVDVE